MQDAPRDFVLGASRTPSVKPADGVSLSASEKTCTIRDFVQCRASKLRRKIYRLLRRAHDFRNTAICSDTWGVEVGPNEIAADCDEDGIYEFCFCGLPLIITGGTGSPINPQAIKQRRRR